VSALLLVLLPVVSALALAAARARPVTMAVLSATGLACTVLAGVQLAVPSDDALLAGLLRLDDTSRLFLFVVDGIFFGVAAYAWNRVHSTPELEAEGQRFAVLSLAFLAACNTVLMANHLLGQWIALEASTLAVAPLIVRPGVAASRQASWRYLLFSFVGLGLVLLGFVCIGRAHEGGADAGGWYLGHLPTPEGPWGTLGLALLLLGLGTKLGLAPMYSWLPEAYDEAPPAVTALLGAVQFNAALMMLLRVVQAWRPSGGALLTGQLLAMGAASVVVSTASLIATRNMKRLLAYASINHAGVIAIGLGIGKGASYGVLLYVLSNAYIKAILFLTAGKIKAHYRTKDTTQIHGLIRDLPYSGVFLMVGTFALLGFPPFGSFFGELLILSALVGSGKTLVFAALCVLVTMSFVATGRTIFPMIWGEPKQPVTWARQTLGSVSPKLFFLVALVALGLYVPPAVEGLLKAVAGTLEAP